MPESIVIAGALAQKPRAGGHTWVFLQYLLGFRRLGWDVMFLDRLPPATCVDAAGARCRAEESVNLKYFVSTMHEYGFEGAYAVMGEDDQPVVGLSRTCVLEYLKRSACVLNINGFVTDVELLGAARKRVFLDIDPAVPQMWRELGWHDLFRGHDDFVTIGENIGQPECTIPTCGLEWTTTRQPVVLSQWPWRPGTGGEFFTSIGSWRGPYGPVAYRGTTYGMRVHEFRKFVELPRRCGRRFQMALDIHPAEVSDLALLDANGWMLVDPGQVAGDPRAYQAYIQASKAEFMVAQSRVVQSRSGWISDRSICYLASGKPVVAQDTGLKKLYPTGRGLLVFSTLEEAVAGIEDVCGNYEAHSRAAREIAEAYFDSDQVLGGLVERVGLR